jgi:hypothetical protein
MLDLGDRSSAMSREASVRFNNKFNEVTAFRPQSPHSGSPVSPDSVLVNNIAARAQRLSCCLQTYRC